MTYSLLPLSLHRDLGFGQIAEYFFKAALNLSEFGPEKIPVGSLLPTAFLYRHSIELYLKSFIIIMHRAYRLPFDNDSPASPAPKLRVGGKWKSLFAEHDVSNLFAYFMGVFATHLRHIPKAQKGDWELDGKVPSWIDAIAKLDAKSDFFRYPVSKNSSDDNKKSKAKEISWKEAISHGNKSDEMIALVMTAGKKRGLVYGKNEPLSQETLQLKHAAFEFELLHNMLRQKFPETTVA